MARTIEEMTADELANAYGAARRRLEMAQYIDSPDTYAQERDAAMAGAIEAEIRRRAP